MSSSTYTPTYEKKDSHPKALPSATIYLGGLLCLAFDGSSKCTVGVNPADKHKWKLQICERGADPKTREWHQDKHGGYKDIRIEVTGGTTGPPMTGSMTPTNATRVYDGADISIPTTTEGRFNLENTWVDLEGERGHGTAAKIDHDANKLRPRFHINDGLFCAFRRSSAKFKLENKNGVVKLVDKVALAVATDIFLKDDATSSIKIILPDETVLLDRTKKYKIYITNDCEKDCDPNKIDFHSHYGGFTEAFSGNPGKMHHDDEFDLKYQTGELPGDPNPILTGCIKSPLTDRAPCMTITLGQTRTLK